MEKGTQQLAQKLLSHIYTTKMLKMISSALEDLSQDRIFKQHATSIVTDPHLTDSQKKTQLMYLFRGIEVPLLYDFFSDELGEDEFWIFNSGKIDYLDRFVQEFQQSTQTVEVVWLTTAVPLSGTDLKAIAKTIHQSIGRKVILDHQVNPALIGGTMVKIGNLVFDYSLRSKFRQFQKEWLKSLDKTEKIIGRNETL